MLKPFVTYLSPLFRLYSPSRKKFWRVDASTGGKAAGAWSWPFTSI